MTLIELQHFFPVISKNFISSVLEIIELKSREISISYLVLNIRLTFLTTIQESESFSKDMGWNLISSPFMTVCNHAVLSPLVSMLSSFTGKGEERRLRSDQIG